MKLKRHSKNSVFLFEIIINLLLFSVLITVGLSFFIKTHTLTDRTRQLHHAVNWCSNLATIYETGDGSLDTINEQYPYAVRINNKLIIYLDDNFNETTDTNYRYSVIVSMQTNSKAYYLNKAKISFYTDNSSTVLYSITACNYHPLTPSAISKEVVE